MEIQKLRYFYTVAEFGHVTRAAEHICIAQPALTQAIKSLERELKVPLFEKRGRNIALTEYGRFLKRRLDAILPQIDGLADEMEQLKGRVNKTIRLNILAASSLVIDEIVRYRKKRPDAVFDFEQNELKNDCDILITTNGASGTDGANGVRGAEAENCVKRCVKEERIYLAVPKASKYADCGSVDLSAVQDERFVMLSDSRPFGVICNKFCAEAGFHPKVLFESDSPTAVQNIIGTGTGVAFWPEYSWGKVKDKNVVLLSVSRPVCKRDLIVELHSRLPRSEYAEEFFEFLAGRLKPFAETEK